MKRKHCPKCSFFNLMTRLTHIKINRKVAFLIQYSRKKKSKYCCHPPFHPPIFCRHSLKLLSPTLPKLINWILLSPPSLSSDPATPQNLARARCTFQILGGWQGRRTLHVSPSLPPPLILKAKLKIFVTLPS